MSKSRPFSERCEPGGKIRGRVDELMNEELRVAATGIRGSEADTFIDRNGHVSGNRDQCHVLAEQ